MVLNLSNLPNLPKVLFDTNLIEACQIHFADLLTIHLHKYFHLHNTFDPNNFVCFDTIRLRNIDLVCNNSFHGPKQQNQHGKIRINMSFVIALEMPKIQ